VFPGGHFYLTEHPDALAALVVSAANASTRRD
jgi:surfactin synthase thioesterase subunit